MTTAKSGGIVLLGAPGVPDSVPASWKSPVLPGSFEVVRVPCPPLVSRTMGSGSEDCLLAQRYPNGHGSSLRRQTDLFQMGIESVVAGAGDFTGGYRQGFRGPQVQYY